MTFFYTLLEKPQMNVTDQTYQIKQDRIGTEIRPYPDPNVLAKIRNYIIRNKSLSNIEIDQEWLNSKLK